MVHLVFFVSCVLGVFPGFHRKRQQQQQSFQPAKYGGVPVLPKEFIGTNKGTATRVEVGERTFDFKKCENEAPLPSCKAWCTWHPMPKSFVDKMHDVARRYFKKNELSEKIWNSWKSQTEALSTLADAFTKNDCKKEGGIFRIPGSNTKVKEIVNETNEETIANAACKDLTSAIKKLLENEPPLKQPSDRCWENMPKAMNEQTAADIKSNNWVQWFTKLPSYSAVEVVFGMIMDVEETQGHFVESNKEKMNLDNLAVCASVPMFFAGPPQTYAKTGDPLKLLQEAGKIEKRKQEKFKELFYMIKKLTR